MSVKEYLPITKSFIIFEVTEFIITDFYKLGRKNEITHESTS